MSHCDLVRVSQTEDELLDEELYFVLVHGFRYILLFTHYNVLNAS